MLDEASLRRKASRHNLKLFPFNLKIKLARKRKRSLYIMILSFQSSLQILLTHNPSSLLCVKVRVDGRPLRGDGVRPCRGLAGGQRGRLHWLGARAVLLLQWPEPAEVSEVQILSEEVSEGGGRRGLWRSSWSRPVLLSTSPGHSSGEHRQSPGLQAHRPEHPPPWRETDQTTDQYQVQPVRPTCLSASVSQSQDTPVQTVLSLTRPGSGFELDRGTVVGWGRNGSLEDLVNARPGQVSTKNQQYLEMPGLNTQQCVDKYQSLYQVDLSGEN